MTNNTVLRRIRYIFDFSDSKMIEIFALTDHEVTREQICDWLKKDEDPEFVECSDNMLAVFLNGLIVELRGRKDGPQPIAESVLTNNNILTKLKIALNMHADGVLEVLSLSGMQISKHELSALFRKPGNRHYRECQDQLLRNFLRGVQLKIRGSEE